MSKIVVALALCVLLLGAALYIGKSVGDQAVIQGRDVGSSLSGSGVDSNGVIKIQMP